jgi:hypothetical protein
MVKGLTRLRLYRTAHFLNARRLSKLSTFTANEITCAAQLNDEYWLRAITADAA